MSIGDIAEKFDVSPAAVSYVLRDRENSEYKINGVKKASAAESIRSYSDFKAIQDYFLDKGKIRDYMIWTIGVCLGLRISDLVRLKIKHIFNQDFTFRERLFVVEHKTVKSNQCLLTEAFREAVTRYMDSISWDVSMEDYLIHSQKGGMMSETSVWRILKDAQDKLKLPINIGSHTMRKSFANIVACVDNNIIDMNAISKVQGLLNHSDSKTTMTYLGTFSDMYDRARQSVSDFVLGKTGIDELVAGVAETKKIDNILEILQRLDKKE